MAVIQKIDSTKAIKNGYVYIKTGFSIVQSISPKQNVTTPVTVVEGRLTDRYDKITYYSS